MRKNATITGPATHGLTLIETLVVVAMIAILIALLLPALAMAKKKGARVACINNQKQIATALIQYTHNDPEGRFPGTNIVSDATNDVMVTFRLLLDEPLGGVKKVFLRPADTFLFVAGGDPFKKVGLSVFQIHQTSYLFNGSNLSSSNTPRRIKGLNGRTLESIHQPERTVLTLEAPVTTGFSWHEPRNQPNWDVTRPMPIRNVMSFVDGHVDYLKTCMPFIATNGILSEPPACYDYKWGAE